MLNSIAAEFNEKVGKSFTPVQGNPVLMLSNGMIKTVPFANASIAALPCSGVAEKLSTLKCTQNLTDVLGLNIFQVRCPKYCLERFKTESIKLEGSIVYSENSSVCKAIFHSGV